MQILQVWLFTHDYKSWILILKSVHLYQKNCFRWYLEHVYPESQMPLDYFFLGEMRNDASHNCLDTMGRKSGEEVRLYLWENFQSRYGVNKCNFLFSQQSLTLWILQVGMSYCHGLGGNQVFAYTKRQQVILVFHFFPKSFKVLSLNIFVRWCLMTIAWMPLEPRVLWSLWGAMVWGVTRHGSTTRWTSKLICIFLQKEEKEENPLIYKYPQNDLNFS